MKQQKEVKTVSAKSKYHLFWMLGLAMCIVPSALTSYSYFPIWKNRSPAVFASGIVASAGAIILMACVVLPPIAKWMKTLVSKTPSAWFGFLVVSGVLYAVAQVIDALYIIFFTAGISNLCGQVFFFFGNRYKKIAEENDE